MTSEDRARGKGALPDLVCSAMAFIGPACCPFAGNQSRVSESKCVAHGDQLWTGLFPAPT